MITPFVCADPLRSFYHIRKISYLPSLSYHIRNANKFKEPFFRLKPLAGVSAFGYKLRSYVGNNFSQKILIKARVETEWLTCKNLQVFGRTTCKVMHRLVRTCKKLASS